MSDSLNIVVSEPVAHRTPTDWLIGQAIKLLNTEGKSAEVAYNHVTELLRERDDAEKMLLGLLKSAPSEDVSLRWNALYVAGDVGDASAAKSLFQISLESLPKTCKEEEACEGPRDGELLIRTMAVEALQRVAGRHEEARELVLALIKERPAQPVLIEAVKAARALKLTDEARKLLREKDHWILKIESRPVEEIMADPERGDDTKSGHTPPSMRAAQSSPAINCCLPKKEG